MNLDRLKVFLAVAQSESYTRAARDLYLSEPTVYMQIRALEKELGCKLFDKPGRRIALTHAGRVLVEYARQFVTLEEDVNWVLQRMRDDPQESLSIAAGEMVSSYILPPVIVAFRQRFPDVNLIVYNSPPNEEVPEYVLRYSIDLRLTSAEPRFKSTAAERFWCGDLIPCVGHHHRLAAFAAVDVEELKAEEFLWLRFATYTRRRGESALRRMGIKPRSSLVLPNPEAIKRVLIAGHGVAMLPEAAVAVEAQAGSICVLPIPNLRAEFPFYCVWNAARKHTPAAEAFMVMLREAASGFYRSADSPVPAHPDSDVSPS